MKLLILFLLVSVISQAQVENFSSVHSEGYNLVMWDGLDSNIDYYELKASKDGKLFTRIATIKGNNPQRYTYMHKCPYYSYYLLEGVVENGWAIVYYVIQTAEPDYNVGISVYDINGRSVDSTIGLEVLSFRYKGSIFSTIQTQ